ncbi:MULTISPECIES: pseudouridine synthase [Arthrobacter]|uniref:Pseudouridine synthase n=1 Tax=Arthrobacter psychrochitiniphilus TaxID=291045 RepID=A0A2V3DQY9_9MICC|nr:MULTISPECIES: pseudouridine synthase [Arthrobacter]NYG17353.1 pseudouridine synthase [Arthrobacter psychrochitiniphilus]PXA65394.1 pseudouridine synthase [Arthrobacter psychrochitiniphilus]
MTPSPRSGNSSGQNQPRGGKPRSGAPKTGGFKSGGSKFGAPKSGGYKSNSGDGHLKPGALRAAGYNAEKASAASASGYKSGAPKLGGPKAAANKPKTGARKPSQTGARPYNNEQYGRTVSSSKARPTEQNRRPLRTTDDIDIHNAEGVRLQKVMAMAGVASRRLCEDMILEGRVQVDGVTVNQLGLRVDPQAVEIVVDGMTIQTNDELVYMVFNKPKGVVSTMEDPEGRPCISDFLKKRQTAERLFHVGRLDTGTEGLLLLTNDGELSNRLSHPKYGIPKTYLVQVRGPMAHGVGAQLKDGVELEDGWQKVDSFRLVDSTPGHVLAEVVLHSGKNRIVRRMFDAVGYPVERLVRVKFGPIALGDQRQGSIRVLGRHEIGFLLSDVGM